MNSNINIPNHVSIIMDGNGRWAKEKGMDRSKGHTAGSDNLKKLCEYIHGKGVKILSVYAFSTENFKRSKKEVDFLMNLFVKKFNDELDFYLEKNIKIIFSGTKDNLPKRVIETIETTTDKTKNNTGGIFNVCLNYGGHSEIVDTCKKICNKVLNKEINIDDINKELFEKNLYHDLPPIDLLIRTSGEIRVSNYMLWQMSYAELYFTKTYFPDFDNDEFDKALVEYTKRTRKFGDVKDEEKTN